MKIFLQILLATLLPLVANAADQGIGKETAFTRSLKTNETAQAWRAALGITNYFLVAASGVSVTTNITGKNITWMVSAGGGGGGGGGQPPCEGLIIRDAPSSPEPDPPNRTCVWRLIFRNDSPMLIWDNVNFLWF